MNEVLRERIKEIAAARVRYGYRRIHVLLQREARRSTPSAPRGCIRKKT